MNSKNKEPRDENGEPHGYWEIYWRGGGLFYKGYFLHGHKEGYWEDNIGINGKIILIKYYIR